MYQLRTQVTDEIQSRSGTNAASPTSGDPKPKAGAPATGGNPAAGLLGDKPPLALGKDAAEDVAGSLKIHIKLALEIDIQITARIKGKSGLVPVVSNSANPCARRHRHRYVPIFALCVRGVDLPGIA